MDKGGGKGAVTGTGAGRWSLALSGFARFDQLEGQEQEKNKEQYPIRHLYDRRIRAGGDRV